MTLRKIYAAISLLGMWGIFCASSIVAQSPSISPRIGFGLAGEYMNSEANLAISPSGDLPSTINVNQSQVGKKLQLAPCIELGAIISHNYYLGFLASWRYSGAKNASRSPIDGTYYFLHSFKMNHYADFLIKVGYMCAPRIMVYGLIGPSFVKWTHTTDWLNGDTPATPTLIDKFKVARHSLGLGLGIGFEYFFQDKYAVSINYTRYLYRTASHSKNITYEKLQGLDLVSRSGDLIKRIRPSYSTIAIRFTTYFQL
jgi:opacity protein-like surface antigen